MALPIEHDDIELATAWLVEGSPRNANYVNGLMPDIFDHYFTIYFPVGLKDDQEQVNPVTYRELAELSSLPYEEGFAYSRLIDKYKGLPADFVVMKDKDALFMQQLVQVLDPTEPCTYYGFGDDVLKEVYMQPWLLRGHSTDLPALFADLNEENYHDWNFFPEYIFSDRKRWCIGNKVFQSGLFVIGCYADTAEKIRAQHEFEYMEISYQSKYFQFIKKD
jgi:hypothetical protein